ncbi:aminotransferase class III-fold pyridoxal phosphate-dependent enzyme [uncultured Microbulbifer sp.]|uniref:aminotransferase family protein n=1 Tax=uncultured Microbulbifer sp. TaxID=348147 RepID=UPI00263321AA|nr:aminotransferase class III-fold pyridoxal phosphate-dependent enzyme [uncultured Microbulbifer sp.]
MSALWYPYACPNTEPSLKLVRGDGVYVVDSQGREYINGAGGLWNITLGLNNRELASRMTAQLELMAYGTLFNSSHPPAQQLAERLVELSNGLMEKVYLSTTGSSAVEVAIRAAKLSQRARGNDEKKEVISFDKSYHGCSLMNLSASGLKHADLMRWEDILPGFHLIPSPDEEGRSLDALSTLLEARREHIACLVMEPILGSAGLLVPSKQYCEQLGNLCKEHEVLLIADEVATGGGRCGAMFASGLLGLEPDIITLSKALNSGYYPLGATLFKRHVVEPIEKAGAPLLYGSTQDGNPVACAAALATLDYLESHDLYNRAVSLGGMIRRELEGLLGSSAVKEIRGLGIMLGIELAHQNGTPFTLKEVIAVRAQCQEEGLLVYHYDSGLSLFPPMTLSDEEAENLLDILKSVLCRVL